MDPKIYLAYDGSINADWVCRYAIHMAKNSCAGKLTLLHILDGLTSIEKVKNKIESMRKVCHSYDADFQSEFIPMDKNVFTTLSHAIPAGETNYCICGMRRTSKSKGFLAGTVSEKLLRCKLFNVLAIRVVNPGLLGNPGDLLFPLAGHPRGFKAAMPFFLMLIPSIQKLLVLRIMCVNPLWFRYMSAADAGKQLGKGKEYVAKVTEDIREHITNKDLQIDSHVVVSDDWAKEILIQAGSLRSRMILLGASDRNLPSRFFYGNTMEQILRKTPCDIGIYRKI